MPNASEVHTRFIQINKIFTLMKLTRKILLFCADLFYSISMNEICFGPGTILFDLWKCLSTFSKTKHIFFLSCQTQLCWCKNDENHQSQHNWAVEPQVYYYFHVLSAVSTTPAPTNMEICWSSHLSSHYMTGETADGCLCCCREKKVSTGPIFPKSRAGFFKLQ